MINTPHGFDYKKEVAKDLYKFGFKKQYVKYLINEFSDKIWSCYNKDAYLSVHHVVDDLVKTIDTDIDFVLQNMRAKYRDKYRVITRDIKDHYNTWQLVQIIIEYANGRFDPISTKAFLYNPTIENEWFRNENQVLCYNATTTYSIIKSIKTLQIDPKHQLFYHATNWKNVEGIIEEGPVHSIGRTCLDFGNMGSFYLTPDVNLAIKWASRECFNNEGALVVFSLNVEDLTNSIIFETPNDKWKTLVKESRTCEDDDNELDTYNFVYGPMLKNVGDIIKSDVEAEAHLPIRWQLASKNETSDNILRESMLGVIFRTAGSAAPPCGATRSVTKTQ